MPRTPNTMPPYRVSAPGKFFGRWLASAFATYAYVYIRAYTYNDFFYLDTYLAITFSLKRFLLVKSVGAHSDYLFGNTAKCLLALKSTSYGLRR